MLTIEERAEKAAKWRKIELESAELLALYQHPKVQEFFELMEAAETKAMLGAAPHDDETRRGAALMLQVLQKFKGYLSTGADVGKRAGEAYADYVNNQDEG